MFSGNQKWALIKKNLVLLSFCLILIPVTQGIAFAGPLAANESLGQFRFSEFSLTPQLRISESGNDGFLIEKTWLGFEWIKEESLRGQIWLGSSELSNPAIWFTPVSRPDFGIQEAFLEGKSILGDFKAGLLNIRQGFEGSQSESNWIFPETFARRSKWFIKRDYGFQFRFQTNPYLTIFSVHNGESSTNSDGKFWYSGLWQFKNSEGFGLLLTASTGQTKSDSTSGSVAQTQQKFVFDKSLESKLRYGTFALFREDGRSLFLLETASGEILQGNQKNRYNWGHFDLAWHLGGDVKLLLRYEQLQPNLDLTQTLIKKSSLGWVAVSKDRLQSMTVIATRSQEDPEITNDEFSLIFRLNSRYLN